jgi:hypothetical protein
MTEDDFEITKIMHIFNAIADTCENDAITLNALISSYFKICHESGLSLEEIRDSFQEALIIFANKIKDGVLKDNPGVNQ